MSGQAKDFWMPHEQESLMTPADHETQADLEHTSLSQFIEDIDRRSNTTQHDFGNDGSITLTQMRGDNEASSKRALVLFYPYGNGSTPAMKLRGRVYQAYLGDDRQVVSVPNNMFMKPTYTLSENVPPTHAVAQNTVRALQEVGIEEVDVVGESLGAMFGSFALLAAYDHLDVKSASLKDAPNTVDRSDKQLKKDFQGKGTENLQKLNQVIHMTGLPALVDAQHAHGGFRAIPQMLGLARFQLGAMYGPNAQLRPSMAERTFVDTLVASPVATQLGSHLQIVRYESSAICTPEIETDLASHGLLENLVTVKYLGHEGTDHVVMNALLNRTAIAS